MFNLKPVYDKEITMADFCADYTRDTLRQNTKDFYDEVLRHIETCTDADVTFQPVDPEANDPYAVEDEQNMAWTLGHVIVHLTASNEESAFLAAEMARGVKLHGRSRYETPWESVTTMEQVRHRLSESRRMCLATLDVWPDEPHLDVTVQLSYIDGRINAYGYYMTGLGHGASHLAQIADIVAQAKAAA